MDYIYIYDYKFRWNGLSFSSLLGFIKNIFICALKINECV